ncbi:MBOAT family protein [Planktothrix sp. FACHB-1355]|uniref:MBOAT family protein n=1 Tax=Aerosakkonema funiforme FACHB-1375 TaxID=2949571 RepID=A0A926V9Z0_9CYAN|nr:MULTISPECIES: MBOAT family protein [Oscillatoriales]MBD2179921.1 MBOAT family protein [Aerosakkonema funiforme FACHB-1375]MBD3562188.1 MBOAT family protein [Planktothrix sp. FACHB-1355]
MTFVSALYGIFLLSVLAIYWLVQNQGLRLWVLLIASLAFYATLQIQYIPLLFVVILINFRLGIALGERAVPRLNPSDWHLSNEEWKYIEQDWDKRRQKILRFGIVLNVLLLLGFKYVPFFLNTVGALLNLPVIQEQASWVTLHLIAPLGISFFCFECIAYLIDVYRGAPATKEFLKFAAYKFFFAKLISGPITRYHHLAAQLNTVRFPSSDRIVEGLWLIACGAFKKALLADNLGIFVKLCFDNLQRTGSGDLWLAILAYGLQLYLDFSGYVDIAIGSAILLGLNLPQNFDFPYFSTSIADFWRRWHMTLGDWLRNYLYFPLGGSRQGLVRTCLNLSIVMLVAGIWHGAAWGFIVWGGLHGLALVVHRLAEALSHRFSALKDWWQSIPGTLVAWLLTQLMVFASWIFFRLPNLKDAAWVIQHLWGHKADVQFAQKVYVEALGLEPFQLVMLLWGIVAFMAIGFALHRNMKLQLNWPIKIFLVPLSLYAVWQLAPKEGLPYIYFDF